MNNFQYQVYMRSFYKRMRPDLTDSEFYKWKETYKLGEMFMNQLSMRNNLEILRAAVSGQTSLSPSRRGAFEETSRKLTAPFVKHYRYTVPRTWKDASTIVAWMQTKLDRIGKYELGYPLAQPTMTPDQVQGKQDALVDRFVREMRKAPKAATEESE
eukprot:CAMPEP_0176444358 /NCGR_PEP_ID=MMETSP0127-20121128/23015_1 /TAXON_ID=938130 /ORGANISM="Platyophrya macrostoma, Strain WH" /LENGTH=156 /DNA_ID=CAMNT_0017829851 /DNA_START=108 /DNA_END=578 /DNA_ORIENTATION=+